MRPRGPASYFRSYEYELMLYERMGDKAKVLALIEEMEASPLNILSKHTGTLDNMVKATHNAGDDQKAIALFRNNIMWHPTHFASSEAVMKVYLWRGHRPVAESVLEKFIASGGSEGEIAGL